MIVVRDIIDRVHRALGTSDRQVVFDHLSDAVEALANKSDWSPLTGYADICVSDDKCVVLPRDVEVVLGLNIGGRPSFPRDQWFEFHLNGPGSDDRPSGFRWDDRGQTPVVRHPEAPARLYAVLQDAQDEGVNLRVYGYDENGLWIRTDGQDGFLVPTFADPAYPNPDAPLVTRITRIRKGVSEGHIKLLAHDDCNDHPILIGHYQPGETDPNYRKLLLPTHATWVRILYRKRTHVITSLEDVIPLHSRLAVVLMCKALHAYETGSIANARQFEAAAVGYLEDEQRTSTIARTSPIQVSPANQLFHEVLD